MSRWRVLTDEEQKWFDIQWARLHGLAENNEQVVDKQGAELHVAAAIDFALEEQQKKVKSYQQAFEKLFSVEQGYGEAQDMLEELGLLVSVPADKEFKEEWGEDAQTMYVWEWSPSALNKEKR